MLIELLFISGQMKSLPFGEKTNGFNSEKVDASKFSKLKIEKKLDKTGILFYFKKILVACVKAFAFEA